MSIHTEYLDCVGRRLNVGDHVGVAFSWSHASVGYIRLGTIESLEPEFHMRWDEGGKVSPPMVFNSKRMVLLT